MNNNNYNPKKGNGSERKTLENLSPTDVFGDPSPTDADGVTSCSGEFILWTDDSGNIRVEQQDGERISRRVLNYLQRLDERGYATNVFREGHPQVKISVDTCVIAHKEDTDRETNELGDAEDLLPIVAEAL